MNSLKALDETKLKAFHWRIVFTAGMGFFTDAYDLFVIGVVTALLTPLWHLSTSQIAILNGAALASSAIGAIFFGYLADVYGRKRMYGVEVVILFIGAILSAFTHSFWTLLATRVLVGLGIGGDYPASAVFASEYSNRKNRGFLILLVFAMQALGLIVGPLLASIFLFYHINYDLVWRLLVGLGALPAASVFYLRRRIPESPRFLIAKKQLPFEVSRVVADLTGYTKQALSETFEKQSIWQKKWLLCLIGTAGAWFFLDIAFYGNSLSSVLILRSLNPGNSLLIDTLLTGLMFLVFAVPGYILAAYNIDRIGRRRLQMLGFVMIGIIFSLLGLIPALHENISWFILAFGISFFFINFGPNTTTFLIPAEVYPTSIRAEAHGVSAAVGKIGAFIGVFMLPYVLHHEGLAFIFILMSIVSLLGLMVTFLIPEMSNVSLDATEVIADN
ncbi:MAG: MFS transporter [Gammaproteobacteria bacterium]